MISESWTWHTNEAVRQPASTTTSGIKYSLFNLCQYFPKVALGQSRRLGLVSSLRLGYLVIVYCYPKNNNGNNNNS